MKIINVAELGGLEALMEVIPENVIRETIERSFGNPPVSNYFQDYFNPAFIVTISDGNGGYKGIGIVEAMTSYPLTTSQGTVDVDISDDPVFYLDKFGVKPEFRGTATAQELFHGIVTATDGEFAFRTRPENDRANKFYSGLVFKRAGYVWVPDEERCTLPKQNSAKLDFVLSEHGGQQWLQYATKQLYHSDKFWNVVPVIAARAATIDKAA